MAKASIFQKKKIGFEFLSLISYFPEKISQNGQNLPEIRYFPMYHHKSVCFGDLAPDSKLLTFEESEKSF